MIRPSVPARLQRSARVRVGSAAVLAVPLVAATLGAATAAPAGAASPACPTPPDRVRLTWSASGPDTDVRTTTGRWPERQASVRDGVRRSGLGLGLDPEVRTVRDRRGVGHPVLCAGGKVRARLPELSRGTVVGAASANGSWLAWRTAKRGALGRVYVGQVVNGRLRAARYRETVRGVAGEIVNGNFVVTASGTVAWTIGPGPQDRDVHSVGAVWPRGSEVSQVPVPDQPSAESEMPAGRPIFVLNDHEVQLDSRASRPVAFRAPTAGPCPDVIDGQTAPFAGWRLALTDVASFSFAAKSSDTTRGYTVCDPATGEDLYFGAVRSGYGFAGYDDTTALVRAGNRLLVATESIGAGAFFHSDAVTIVDATTGTSRTYPGWLSTPGSTPPRKLSLEPDPAIAGPAVAAAPGVLAIVARSDAGPSTTLTVEDATGTRVLSTGTAITGLRIDGDRVRWSTDGTAGDAAVTPVAGAPFVVGPGIDEWTRLR